MTVSRAAGCERVPSNLVHFARDPPASRSRLSGGTRLLGPRESSFLSHDGTRMFSFQHNLNPLFLFSEIETDAAQSAGKTLISALEQ